MTWKYRVTGFEYYCYNIWERNFAADPAQRYPRVKWKADGWSRGWPSNGDGMLFYPGPISSLRFEAIRDGIEDWESHLVLRDAVEALGDRDAAVAAEAHKLLAVGDDIVAGFKAYTHDPDLLLARREALGDAIARCIAVIGPDALERVAKARVAREAARRRTMLRERHLAACKKLGVAPLSQQQWGALWPKTN